MATQKEAPYVCHIMVCVNDRHGERKSCADAGSVELRAKLKEAVAERGWKPRVRVSQCGCMGLCEEGPNVIIYPQKTWFSAASPDDAERILSQVAEFLDLDV